VTLSPTLRSSDPPQVLHTPGGACTTSRRGNSGGSWRLWLGVRRFRLGLRPRCNRLGLRRLGFLQRQLKLFENPLDPLRAGAELLSTELGDLGFQLLNRQLRDDEAVLCRCQLGVLGNQQRFERRDVVQKLIERERHAQGLSASRTTRAESCRRSARMIWRFALIPPMSGPKLVAEFATRVLRATSTSVPGSE